MDRKALETPGSDEWWMRKLFQKLTVNAKESVEMAAWMDGRPPIPVPDNQKPNFERLQRVANINLASLIVDARLHRLQLMGASTRVDSSANGDDVVATIFEEEDLARKLHTAFRLALSQHRAYLFLTGDGRIRVADARHAVTEDDEDGNTVAALSIYRDEAKDRDVAILARPGYFRVAHHDGATVLPRGRWWALNPLSWEFGERQETSFDFVPAYELTPPGGSLIAAHLPTLERINHGILQRMIIIAMQAFRQRGLKNAPDEDPETGEKVDYDGMFESAPDSLWLLPEGVEVWESGQADLSPVLNAVKDDIRFLAASSKTPLFMISPDDANGSATGADTQRETILFDVEAISAYMTHPLKRMLSDALRIRGDEERADISGIRLKWVNPRRSSITERANAANTAKQAGVPFRLRMEKFAEMTPDEVEEAERQRGDDAFADALVSGAGGG